MIQIKSNNITKFEISSHDILSLLYSLPEDHDELYTSIISDEYICLSYSIADGQGGGFAIINVITGKWIYKTNEFFVQNILWIPKHKYFVCINDIPTYAYHIISLVLIDLSGKITSLQLYNSNQQSVPVELNGLTNISDEGGTSETEPSLSYNSDDDSIQINLYGHWACNFQKLIDSPEFN